MPDEIEAVADAIDEIADAIEDADDSDKKDISWKETLELAKPWHSCGKLRNRPCSQPSGQQAGHFAGETVLRERQEAYASSPSAETEDRSRFGPRPVAHAALQRASSAELSRAGWPIVSSRAGRRSRLPCTIGDTYAAREPRSRAGCPAGWNSLFRVSPSYSMVVVP